MITQSSKYHYKNTTDCHGKKENIQGARNINRFD